MSLGSPHVRPISGASRISVGVAALTWFATLFAGYVLTLVIFGVAGLAGTPSGELPAWATVVSVAVLWIPQLIGLRLVTRRLASGRWADDLGFRFRPVDLIGLPIGVLCQLVLLELLYWPLRTWLPGTFDRQLIEEPARNLFDRATGSWELALVVVVVIGAPIVEELVYRGLIFRSIEGRLAAPLAVVTSAIWFGLAHVQTVQLPGLVAFGVVLAWCAHRTGRLGMSIFAHAAFNATTVALLLLPGFEGVVR